MGGIVAYEMAQQLCSQGQKVALLAVIDMWAPRTRAVAKNVKTGEGDEVALLIGFASQLLGMSLENLNISRPDFLQLETDEQLIHVFEQAKVAREVSLDIESHHIPRHFDVYRANMHAVRNYVAKPYPDRVTLFMSSEHHVTNEGKGSDMGWNNLAEGGIEVHVIPGDHFALVRTPSVEVLAERLRSCLNKVQMVSL